MRIFKIGLCLILISLICLTGCTDTSGNPLTMEGESAGVPLSVRIDTSNGNYMVISGNLTISGVAANVTLTSSDIIAALGFTPVANTTTINSYPLSANVTLSSSDVGALSTANVTTNPAAGLVPAANSNKTVDSWVSKTVYVICLDQATALTTGNGKAYFTVPSILNGMNIVEVAATVYTVSSSGTPTFGIYNLTDSKNICSTNITIDANEYSSYTATTAAVIDTGADDVATGDRLRLDCTVAGTSTKGMDIIMIFRTP